MTYQAALQGHTHSIYSRRGAWCWLMQVDGVWRRWWGFDCRVCIVEQGLCATSCNRGDQSQAGVFALENLDMLVQLNLLSRHWLLLQTLCGS